MTTDFRATTLAEYSVYRVTPAGCVPCVVPPYQLQIFGKRRFAAQVSVAGKAPMGYSSRRKFTALLLLLLSGRYISRFPRLHIASGIISKNVKNNCLQITPKPFHAFWDFILLRKSLKKTSHNK